MAYASGEKRNGSSSLGAPGPPGTSSSPCPPSQPRKGTSSRPVLSARSSTSANGSQPTSGPLVASVLGGSYAYHSRNPSPAPQRNTASPQHVSSQRSTSASLQRSTSSSRQRSSHGQVPGKPFFAAYGLQYSNNGRSNSGIGNRASANMSPYRNRPSSSTGPPSTGIPTAMAAAAGRPSTSQAPQRASGENWFGNTKLSVTLPNEAARVVQELGHLLSVFAPPSPSGGPQGVKAPASFRASKYVGGTGAGGGSGNNPHKEAWGSSAGDISMSSSGGGPMLRPNSAASSTGSASKPMMASFMADGRHSHGQAANLSLMRLQQQQQQQHQHQGMYGGLPGTGSVLSTVGSGPAPSSSQYQHVSQTGGVPGAAYMHHPYGGFQSPNGSYQAQSSSGGGGGGSSGGGAPQPPRLNLAMVGSTSPISSPKEPGTGGGSGSPGGASPGASPHGMPSGSGYPPYPSFPHAPNGPPPGRSWDASYVPSGVSGYPQAGSQHASSGPAYLGMAGAVAQPSPQLVSPRPSASSTSSNGQYHYLPSVDGAVSTSAPTTASGAAATVGYTTMTVAASGATSQPTYSQSSSFHAPSPTTYPGFSSTAPVSSSFNSAMAAAAAVALGTHPPPQPLPVPTSAGPVPQAPPSSLAPSPHSAPLHVTQQTAGAAAGGAATTAGNSSGSAAPGTAAMYSPAAAKIMRDSLLATASGNSSSGNVSSPSPSSSSSQVQPAPPASAFAAAAASAASAASSTAPSPSGPAAASITALRSSSLANAPHPVGLPPPSPLKVAPPSGAPTASRGTFIRSNSSRSSNGSGYDSVPYYGGALATVPDSEREEPASSVSSMGSNAAQAQQQQQERTPAQGSTPSRSAYPSSDGTTGVMASAAAAGGAAPGTPASPGFAPVVAQLSGPAGSGNSGTSSGGGAHVTWGATVTTTVPTPSTPTRMHTNYSYSDLTTRRISSSSAGPVNGLDLGSPFTRGSDGHSRMLVEHGTLTCVRPSTVPSNFAADSQTDLGAYAEPQGPAAAGAGGSSAEVSVSTGMYGGFAAGTATAASAAAGGQTWAPSSLAAATATAAASMYGQGAAAAAAAAALQQPWRKSTDGVADLTGAAAAGASSSSQQQRQGQQHAGDGSGTQSSAPAAAAAASSSGQSAASPSPHSYASGQHRDEGSAWGRPRDATPSRMYGQAGPTAVQQQQQQVESQQTTAADAVAASAAAAAAAMAAASAAAAAVRQAVAAATEAHAHGGSQRGTGSSGMGTGTNQQAPTSASSTATGGHAASTSTPTTAAVTSTTTTTAAASASVPLPADQPLRPKSTSPLSPRYSPWTDAGSKPHSAAGAAGASVSAASPSTPAAAATSGTAAAASGSSPPTSSSPAGSSAAGSAVSSGSTSSGTVSSSYTAAGSSGGSSGAGSGSAGHHTSTMRRSSSIVARFNPSSVLGSEPDPTFGNLLPGYSVGKVIGEGGFCQVRLAVHHLSQRKVAVKVIDRAKLVDPNEAKRMQREIRVMKHLSHQCVIKLFEVVESPRHLFLVMEHAPSGSLLDYVRARKRLPEADACLFFQQIVASLEYCHSREVVHRDIKLENILLDVDQRMKLIDFGLSAFFVPGKRLRVHCGSPSYAAPEIVARKAYEGPPVDVWSLGVVLFAMVAGYLPFHASGGNKQELCNKIIAGQYTAPEWLSSSMKDLLARMLTTDPEKRITFPQVWQHSWVRNGPQWHERGVNCYEVLPDPSAPGGLRCDEQVVAELEAAGYSRSTLTQHLVAGEATHLTASYFLLCEAKADALRRMRGSSSSNPRGVRSSSSSAGASVRASSVSASMTNHGSAQLAAAVAKARTMESPGRGGGTSSSRPSTAMTGGSYPSARSHRGGHQGEEMAAGRMAVAV